MAKRKRKPGEREGFKLNLSKDYHSERYVMHLMNAEIGLLQAGTINEDLTDGKVIEALEDLILQLQEPELFTQLLLSPTPAEHEELPAVKDDGTYTLAQHLVLMNLRSAFKQYRPLEAEEVIGILEVIKTSVKRHSVGMHRRGYLNFLKGFLGQMGVQVRQISAEEANELELRPLDDPE